MRTFEQHWENIEENFRWERVYIVMKALDWCWVNSNNDASIPSITLIKKIAKEICERCFNSESKNLSTGGFSSVYDPQYDNLELAFNIEEWATIETQQKEGE